MSIWNLCNAANKGGNDADTKLPPNFHLKGYTAETMRRCNTLQLFTIVHKLILQTRFLYQILALCNYASKHRVASLCTNHIKTCKRVFTCEVQHNYRRSY